MVRVIVERTTNRRHIVDVRLFSTFDFSAQLFSPFLPTSSFALVNRYSNPCSLCTALNWMLMRGIGKHAGFSSFTLKSLNCWCSSFLRDFCNDPKSGVCSSVQVLSRVLAIELSSRTWILDACNYSSSEANSDLFTSMSIDMKRELGDVIGGAPLL